MTRNACALKCGSVPKSVYKVPDHNEVRSIIDVKAWFQEPMATLRKRLDNLDEGCKHGHYFSQIHLEDMDDLSTEEQELCRRLKGHPIPCASGDCSSLLRTLAAAAVH